MFPRSGDRFADKNMRHSITAGTRSDSEGTGRVLVVEHDVRGFDQLVEMPALLQPDQQQNAG